MNCLDCANCHPNYPNLCKKDGEPEVQAFWDDYETDMREFDARLCPGFEQEPTTTTIKSGEKV